MINQEGKIIYQFTLYEIFSFFIFLAFFAGLTFIQVYENSSVIIVQNELLNSQIQELIVLKKQLAQKTANLEVELHTVEEKHKSNNIEAITIFVVVFCATAFVVCLNSIIIFR
jgi:hypothetical protein